MYENDNYKVIEDHQNQEYRILNKRNGFVEHTCKVMVEALRMAAIFDFNLKVWEDQQKNGNSNEENDGNSLEVWDVKNTRMN